MLFDSVLLNKDEKGLYGIDPRTGSAPPSLKISPFFFFAIFPESAFQIKGDEHF